MNRAVFLKMLKALSYVGVHPRRLPGWSDEEWANHIIHKFDTHVIPSALENVIESRTLMWRMRGGVRRG